MFLSELSHSQHKLKDTHDYHAVLKEFERDIEVSKAQGYLYMNQIEDEIHATHHYLTTQKKELDSFNRQLKDLILELALLITVAD